MGEKLIHFYEKAKSLGGIKAQMRMAVITRISSVRAKELPDTPANLATFQEALEEIEKEFKQQEA